MNEYHQILTQNHFCKCVHVKAHVVFKNQNLLFLQPHSTYT